MSAPRIGSLCSGYGGLDMAVEAVIPDADLAWVSDIDKGACKVLAHRYPDVPNLGDMTAVDWASVEPVDILTGGTPCQDLSHAGKRAGMTAGTRSNLWVAMREAIATIRPALVVWENVGGAYSANAASELESDARLLADTRRRDGEPVLRALGRVLGDLASLGYDSGWHGLRAADVGAPHGRLRVFVVAYPKGHAWRFIYGDGETPADASNLGHEWRGRPRGRWDGPADGSLLPTPRATDGTNGGPNQRGSSGDLMLPSAVTHLLPTPNPFHAGNTESPEEWRRRRLDVFERTGTRHGPALSVVAWSVAEGNPLDPDHYMPDDEEREEWELRLAGNGVVWQQAAAALRIMLARAEDVAA